MMPSEEYSYVSSKLIKEAAALGANLKEFVPSYVEKELRKRMNRK
jgi:phosphopantetheine adenylyltransferase